MESYQITDRKNYYTLNKMKSKRILVTNDDGIGAAGLDVLKEKLSALGEVTLVVPEVPKSAAANSMTLHKPVRINKVEDRKYSVSGTPVDCVRIGVLTILNDEVDLVVSGINEGANLGDDVNYSGTVAGAREATLMGIPSIAVSLVIGENKNFVQAADITVEIVKKILEHGLPERKLLNLNIPDVKTGKVKGIKITRLCIRIYDRKIRERKDPAGRKYYWILGDILDAIIEEGTDFEAISRNYASLTPVSLDYTDYSFTEELKNWGSI